MVMARLHIICGNCGNYMGEDDRLEIKRDYHDITQDEPEFLDGATISCHNCATLHDLATTVPIDCTTNKVNDDEQEKYRVK